MIGHICHGHNPSLNIERQFSNLCKALLNELARSILISYQKTR